MHLVQILLPLRDNEGRPFPQSMFVDLRDRLVERFGGITVYSRAPAEGLWKEDRDATTHDTIVIYEVMARELDRAWWADRRRDLEALFRQDTVIIRASELTLL